MLNPNLTHNELLLVRNILFYAIDTMCGELQYDPSDPDCTKCGHSTLCVEVHKALAQVQEKVNRKQ